MKGILVVLHMKNENRQIFRALSLLSQIGLSILTTIFLSVFVGTKLDAHLGTNYWFPIWLVLGMMAGIRNILKLVKRFYQKDKEKEDKELKYFEELRKQDTKRRDD